MKKISYILLFAVCAVSVEVSAQSKNYTPWQINGTVGYAILSGKGAKGGVAIHVEPQYHVNANVSVGLRYALAFVSKSSLDASGNIVEDKYSAAGITSYLATGNYYFQTSPGASFRPFVGIGLGYASAAGLDVTVSTGTSTATASASADGGAKSGFGGMVRAGFDVNHFRFNVEYALNPKTGKISSNYIGINLGFYFGGGSRK